MKGGVSGSNQLGGDLKASQKAICVLALCLDGAVGLLYKVLVCLLSILLIPDRVILHSLSNADFPLGKRRIVTEMWDG